MKRDEIYENLVNKGAKNNLLILPTGYGKSKYAIDLALHYKCEKLLIVVPKLVLIKNWTAELEKWTAGKKTHMEAVFSTYASIHKWAGLSYDMVIWDEAHHITERVMDIVPTINAKYSMLLSATVKRDKLYALKEVFPELNVVRHTLKDAIEEEILPQPKVFLVQLSLNPDKKDTIVIRKTGNKPIIKGDFHQLKKLKSVYPMNRIEISCHQLQKNLYYSNEIDYWKRRYILTQQEFLKNNWLRIAGERLKWLSDIKTDIVTRILEKLSGKRVITFCSSIRQTVELGMNNISSKNKKASEVLKNFNDGKIEHITACEMLNEGVNLTNCQIGLFAAINSSEIMQIQKVGRLLRHKNPILIVPYFHNTRDEEIIVKMFEGQEVEKISLNNLLTMLKQ